MKLSALRNRLLPWISCGLILPLAANAQLAASGSLWNNGYSESRNMVSDHLAGNIGDIVTITVSENAQATASQRLSSDRNNTVEDQIGQLLYSQAVSSHFSRDGEMPAMNWNGMNQYTGGGEINNSQNLNARAAVMITDRLPNGNLVIEGVRAIIFSNEETNVYIRGIIRRQDIRADNTVLSSNIAHAQVEFISEGSISSTQRKGWLTRLYEAINPF